MMMWQTKVSCHQVLISDTYPKIHHSHFHSIKAIYVPPLPVALWHILLLWPPRPHLVVLAIIYLFSIHSSKPPSLAGFKAPPQTPKPSPNPHHTILTRFPCRGRFCNLRSKSRGTFLLAPQTSTTSSHFSSYLCRNSPKLVTVFIDVANGQHFSYDDLIHHAKTLALNLTFVDLHAISLFPRSLWFARSLSLFLSLRRWALSTKSKSIKTNKLLRYNT